MSRKLIITLPSACKATGLIDGQSWNRATVHNVVELEVMLGDGGIRLPVVNIEHFTDVKMDPVFKGMMQEAAEEAILAPSLQGAMQVAWREVNDDATAEEVPRAKSTF